MRRRPTYNVRSLMSSTYLHSFYQAKEEMNALKGQPDEEGWVTVTSSRGKRVGGGPTEEKGEGKTRAAKQEKRKRKERELLNFYSFQQRETKRERMRARARENIQIHL
eukprot:m.33422 g.33422  ORF g.33422 m.33422 type:complete len:108 (+) comp31810_c0_seq16:612-935(+)